jgi:hypothetical protein
MIWARLEEKSISSFGNKTETENLRVERRLGVG